MIRKGFYWLELEVSNGTLNPPTRILIMFAMEVIINQMWWWMLLSWSGSLKRVDKDLLTKKIIWLN